MKPKGVIVQLDSQLISVVSLAVALAAVLISVWQVQVNINNERKQNSLPVMVDAWQQWRSPAFHAALLRLLSAKADELGRNRFEALPIELRKDAYGVCYFFDYLGTLVVFGIIDEEFVIGVMANRLMQVWAVMAELIGREREWRIQNYPSGTPTGFLVYYEHLVRRVLDLGGSEAAARIHRRKGVLKLRQNEREFVVKSARNNP
jgi:hypothetical protein